MSLQKIENHKLDWKAEAKTVTRNPNYAPPAKSEKKVSTLPLNENVKVFFKAIEAAVY